MSLPIDDSMLLFSSRFCNTNGMTTDSLFEMSPEVLHICTLQISTRLSWCKACLFLVLRTTTSSLSVVMDTLYNFAVFVYHTSPFFSTFILPHIYHKHFSVISFHSLLLAFPSKQYQLGVWISHAIAVNRFKNNKKHRKQNTKTHNIYKKEEKEKKPSTNTNTKSKMKHRKGLQCGF